MDPGWAEGYPVAEAMAVVVAGVGAGADVGA